MEEEEEEGSHSLPSVLRLMNLGEGLPVTRRWGAEPTEVVECMPSIGSCRHRAARLQAEQDAATGNCHGHAAWLMGQKPEPTCLAARYG